MKSSRFNALRSLAVAVSLHRLVLQSLGPPPPVLVAAGTLQLLDLCFVSYSCSVARRPRLLTSHLIPPPISRFNLPQPLHAVHPLTPGLVSHGDPFTEKTDKSTINLQG